MNNDVIIKMKHINKTYDNKVIIKDLNLDINKGEFITVIGSSGCGKTTVLKMINGLNTPDKGDIFINGKNMKNENIIELRRKIGYSIQGSALFPHLTVEKNISYVLDLINEKNKDEIKESILKLIKVVGLEDNILNRYPDQLSGGQQQRVGIARALAAQPDILLMDEPFGAVDEITRKQLQNEIVKIHKDLGVTTIFITHDIKEALKLGTRVLVMDKGEIVQFNKPEIIKNHPANDFVKELVL
ncbi:ABC transporter ATP-binding protein [Paraclostridium sordellii]|uniref:ATP-binding cassette domain-containing protein n=1 Tax=Paraclostridium sordellii TaxID=1505 RepID=UPI0005DBEE27|nr:ABC transporter ATP-binding protein [Paeniclostridium sordellii]CEP86122.1 ABC transporter glycine betaine/carnitine/choline ATP-binding protein [[Clostridium] sordellii] [Paeniclostridium sordellii]CEP96374.1 ABC transporter glycine betaine/carnitine/choline ATP-binding protein [[Clostridium] sordellii] [Paeniclostridium sordellii]CEQ00160.1 ABC transporter glycine betaine/carnitine/choline ATP-binding protein [[Clostridium] sordellii] [Paeniclostridium sordellii]